MAPALSLLPSLNDEIYSRLRDLIHTRTGLKFGDHQRETMAKTLIKEMKLVAAATPEQYYSLLNSQPINADCWNDLIKALTICETYFFRDLEQMQALRKYILPDLLARHWNDHTLRLWSAGCATGEEAYTLAMLLRQAIPDFDRWKITLLATDINKHALEKARQGHYHNWSFRQQSVDDPLVRTYFIQDHLGYQIQPVIKDMVHFACLNLSEDSFPSSQNLTDQLDLILCRNVTMYLSKEVIQQLARRFYECLLPGGWLMLGASENNDQIYYQFKPLMYEKAIIYQKVVSHSRLSTQPSPGTVTTAPDGTLPVEGIPFQANPISHGPILSHLESGTDLEQVLPTAITATLLQHSTKQLTLPQESAVDSSQSLYQTGMALIKGHQFEEAKAFFLEYLTRHPRDINAQYQLTFIEANSGHLDEAQQMALQMIEQAPLFDKAYAILALVYQEKGDLNLAITQLKKVLYLNPDDIMANFNLAVLYQKQGLINEASRYRQQANKLAGKLQPDDIIPDSDNLSVSDFFNMVHP